MNWQAWSNTSFRKSGKGGRENSLAIDIAIDKNDCILAQYYWGWMHCLLNKPTKLGRCDRATIELAKYSNDSIVRTARRASK